MQAARKQCLSSPGLPSFSPNHHPKDFKGSILSLYLDSGISSVDRQSVGTPSLAEELDEVGEQLDMDKQTEKNLEVPHRFLFALKKKKWKEKMFKIEPKFNSRIKEMELFYVFHKFSF